MKKNAIVLAAGKGTRMCSQQPKVLHKILEVPMAELIVHRLKEAGAETIVTITGYGHEEVEKVLRGQCAFALQQPQLGTGHAVMQAKQLEQEDGATIVINGDAPVIQTETLKALYDGVLDSDMVILTTIPDDAASYGRVVRDEQGRVLKVTTFPKQRMINITSRTSVAAAVKTPPTKTAAHNGAIVYSMMPSSAYSTSFQNDHFVSPAIRRTFSYSTYSVLKPTQTNSPFEKRLRSRKDRIASTTARFINLKSRAPSTISTSA